ncbi:MAG: hypothetical protein WA705_00920 [Candidatus Ozemobacteraceae bacterium]
MRTTIPETVLYKIVKSLRFAGISAGAGSSVGNGPAITIVVSIYRKT